MNEAIKTWPEKIYLQASNGDGGTANRGDAIGDVTWCEHSIDDGDVQYIRQDIFTKNILEVGSLQWVIANMDSGIDKIIEENKKREISIINLCINIAVRKICIDPMDSVKNILNINPKEILDAMEEL